MPIEVDKWTVDGDGKSATHATNGAHLYVWGDGYVHVQLEGKEPLRVPVWLMELLIRKGENDE